MVPATFFPAAAGPERSRVSCASTKGVVPRDASSGKAQARGLVCDRKSRDRTIARDRCVKRLRHAIQLCKVFPPSCGR
jgi:hypothetical protein